MNTSNINPAPNTNANGKLTSLDGEKNQGGVLLVVYQDKEYELQMRRILVVSHRRPFFP